MPPPFEPTFWSIVRAALKLVSTQIGGLTAFPPCGRSRTEPSLPSAIVDGSIWAPSLSVQPSPVKLPADCPGASVYQCESPIERNGWLKDGVVQSVPSTLGGVFVAVAVLAKIPTISEATPPTMAERLPSDPARFKCSFT